MRIKLAPVVKTMWDSLQFVSLREQITSSFRKIQKGVDLGVERERYVNACHTIQLLAFSAAEKILYINSELDIAHLSTPIIEKEKVVFLKNKIDEFGGFISSIDIFYGNATDESPLVMKPVCNKFPESLILLEDKRFIKNPFTNKLRIALSKGEPIGASGKIDRHAMLIRSIKDFVFMEEDQRGQKPFVRFAYNDGSIGGKLFLFCLPEIERPSQNEIISLGLISNRHYDLDNVIDYYLIRNSEISKGEEFYISEQEHMAYKKTSEFFECMLKGKGVFQINLFHTGLESAVIGTYRAIIDILTDSKNRGKIIIKPFITGTQTLSEWF